MSFEVHSIPTFQGLRLVLSPRGKEGPVLTRKNTGKEIGSTDFLPGWPDERKESALIGAAQYGQADRLYALLSSGVDVNARRNGLTALMAAAQKGRADVVRMLLEHGADAIAENSGMTALEIAAFNGHTETARVLLACADLLRCGEQVLARAAKEQNAEMIRLLVERRIAAPDRTLQLACAHGLTEIVRWLCEQGRVDLVEVLRTAAKWGQAEIIKNLIETDGNRLNKAHLNTAIESLLDGLERLPWHPRIRSLILEGQSRRAVWAEIEKSFAEALKHLLEARGSPKTLDPTRMGSLALGHGGVPLRVLFEAGVQMPDELQQELLLFHAQTVDHRTVRTLLESGAPVGAKALRAMMRNDGFCLLQLLRFGKVRWKENEKDLALMWADDAGHNDIAQRLREAGATMPVGEAAPGD
jgi:ankyrin repeat protein